MAQHDYVLDNQSASALRADLNNALQAVATTNSGTTAPSTTYANQLWYETDTNTLWKRDEANSAWINLGTVDETNSKFDPNMTFATQAEAEEGTDNTKPMTALRVKQAASVLLSNTTLSGSSDVISGLDLTPYRLLTIVFIAVSSTNATAHINVEGQRVSPAMSSASDFFRGIGTIDLQTGTAAFNIGIVPGAAPVMATSTPYTGDLDIVSATTSITIAISAGTFDNGSVRIYGHK